MKTPKDMIKKIFDKFKPLPEKEYIITDECYWEMNPPKNYNPYDKTRKPHAVSLVDPETGTVVRLKSGSIIKVVKAK